MRLVLIILASGLLYPFASERGPFEADLGHIAPTAAQAYVYEAPVEAEELTSMHCETCMEGGGLHSFNGDPCGPSQPDCYDCHAFNSCHTNSQDGSCDEYHCGCDQCFELGMMIEEALEADDMSEIATLAANSPERVTININRNAIQVKDCDGHVLAHHLVREQWIEDLAEL